MDAEKYQQFAAEDFIEDEYFRKGALDPNEETEAFWREFLLSHPDKEQAVLEARRLLQAIYSHYDSEARQVPEEQAQASFRSVASAIRRQGQRRARTRRLVLRWAAAASFLLLLGLGGLYFLPFGEQAQVYATGNGERMSIQLPDASTVELNANSSLRYYPEKWRDQRQRQVWLEGEAYFDVQKKAAGTKFMVHAGEVQVEVLGTRFNVRARGQRAEVVLAEGKVELAVAGRTVEMTPGDYVSYDKSERKVESKKVKPSDFTAWKDGIAIFNNTLSEVAKELEILYGVRFRIDNEQLKNRQIQLSAPADSLQQVLETLELMYPEEINIQREDERVIIF